MRATTERVRVVGNGVDGAQALRYDALREVDARESDASRRDGVYVA